ncbi:MAG TPA: aspartate:alanine exchanger family transporter [Roseiflexaceae bacterium]|nr:aspartate:alanine exchanger family transporter [Roseiflexaceae bacterium]
MVQILVANPLLVLFLVAALGYAAGQIKLGGSSLGIAAVLFAGLLVGALDPRLKLPDAIYLLGLVVFVYTIGLSSGPAFFRALRRQGLRDNLLVVGALVFGAMVLVALQRLLQLRPAMVAGIFAGSFTNTPALASVLDYIRSSAPTVLRDQLLSEPVVGYSATYPMGVVGAMLAMVVARRLWRIDYMREAEQLRAQGILNDRLQQRTIRVTRDAVVRQPLGELVRTNHWAVVFGRIQRRERLALATGHTCFELGDLVGVVGTAENIERVSQALGEVSSERLDVDRRQLDYRRIFVSNPNVAGQRLRDLQLMERFGAVVTRVRRGDSDLLPHGDTVLELGDRVRVVTDPQHMDAVSAFFGDSYRAISEVNILTLSLGLALGLLVGLVPIPLPGGVHLSLGYAGGPLLVALILGAYERTGPLVWRLPYSANLTLRQIGLILFLAGIGTRAGSALLTTFTQGNGLELLLVGSVVTCSVALATFWLGYQLLHIPMSVLLGMLAGLQTQPALLSFAAEQTGNDVPDIGYTAVYPVAIIAKIIIAQLVLAWMW